jgi:galactokinase
MPKQAVSDANDALDFDSEEVEEEEAPVDVSVTRWANEVVSEMRRVGLRKALALANRPTDDLGEEDAPL